MYTEIWSAYASAWSAPEPQRHDLLDRHVCPDVAYRDPATEVRGRDALSTYMHSFQQGFPGHEFAIVSVESHHGRSLARWELRDHAGRPVQAGISHAVHDEQQRLADVTGFFAVPPQAAPPADR
ncbi:MAG: nuclear transport factor 2 family protein [Actinobacteria bacterium]|nr:nuclear transport factor 2 family protein [Actinomycetota bacterium]